MTLIFLNYYLFYVCSSVLQKPKVVTSIVKSKVRKIQQIKNCKLLLKLNSMFERTVKSGKNMTNFAVLESIFWWETLFYRCFRWFSESDFWTCLISKKFLNNNWKSVQTDMNQSTYTVFKVSAFRLQDLRS